MIFIDLAGLLLVSVGYTAGYWIRGIVDRRRQKHQSIQHFGGTP